MRSSWWATPEFLNAHQHNRHGRRKASVVSALERSSEQMPHFNDAIGESNLVNTVSSSAREQQREHANSCSGALHMGSHASGRPHHRFFDIVRDRQDQATHD